MRMVVACAFALLAFVPLGFVVFALVLRARACFVAVLLFVLLLMSIVSVARAHLAAPHAVRAPDDQRPDCEPRAARRQVRARADLQPRLRRSASARSLAPAIDWMDWAVAPNLSASGSCRARRGLPARQRGGDHHRRVPQVAPARDGARDQQHRRRHGNVRRPRARRRAGPDRLAPGVPDLRAGRPVRDGLGVPQARGAQQAPARAGRLVGQPHLRGRPRHDHDSVTYGIRPYGGSATGWQSPRVLVLLGGGVVLLAAFVAIEGRVENPMFRLSLSASAPSPSARSRRSSAPSRGAA